MSSDERGGPVIERTRFASFLAELENTLSLMHQLVSGVRSMDGDGPELARVMAIAESLYQQQPALRELPLALHEAYGVITSALGDIRVSRDTIQSHALDRLQRTHERLAEVTSATESATTALLDGLDRSLARIDRLEQVSLEAGGGADVRALAQELRDEMNKLFGVLQFQDITAQQLGAAGDLLSGVEQRLQGVAALLEPERLPGVRPSLGPEPARQGPVVFDERASLHGGEARQELVDTILAEAARTPPGQPAPQVG